MHFQFYEKPIFSVSFLPFGTRKSFGMPSSPPIARLSFVKSGKFAIEVGIPALKIVTRDMRIRKPFFEKIVDYFLSQEFCLSKAENWEGCVKKFMIT